MKINYEHLLAFSEESRGVRANLVYSTIDSDIVGSFFGYEGGGAYADGLFWINNNWDLNLGWDTFDFPEKFHKILDQLTDIRLSFESSEEDGELSKKGYELAKSDNTNEYENSWEYWSNNFDTDVIHTVSASWGLSTRWNAD